MNKYLSALPLIVSMMAAPGAFAGERTVTFAVDNMYCEACPYIVNSSIAAVARLAKLLRFLLAKTAKLNFQVDSTKPEANAVALTHSGQSAPSLQRGGGGSS